MLSGETAFIQMYIDGWYECTASCCCCLTALYALSLRKPGGWQSPLSFVAHLFIAYGAISLVSCNDIVAVFITAELLAVSLFMLLSISGTTVGVLFKYAVLNACGTALFLCGILSAFLNTGAFSMITFSTIPKIGTEFGTVFIVAVLFKLVSAPFFSVSVPLYTRLGTYRISPFMLTLKSAYIVVFLKLVVVVFGLSSGSMRFIVVTTVCAVGILAAGVGALRAKTVVGGLVYSSNQHAAFLVLVLCTPCGREFFIVAAITYFIFYIMTSTILFFCLILRTVTPLRTVLRSICDGVACAAVMSLAGLPPFIGFTSKALLISALLDNHLCFLTGVVVTGNLLIFIFYGRLLLDLLSAVGGPLIDVVTYTTDPAGGTVCVHSRISVFWVVATVSSLTAFVWLTRAVPIITLLVDRTVAPILRSTEFRTAIFGSAFGVLYALTANKYILYSLGNILWTIVLHSGFQRFGDVRGLETFFADPYNPPLMPQHDSRYFWVNEWMIYPWQDLPTDEDIVETSAKEVYRCRGGAIRGMLYRWYMDQDWTTSHDAMWWPLRAFLSLYDPGAYIDTDQHYTSHTERFG